MLMNFQKVSYWNLPELYPLYEQDSQVLALFVNGKVPLNAHEFPILIKRINGCAGAILVDGGANFFAEILEQSQLSGLPISVKPLCLVGDGDSVHNESLVLLKEHYPEMGQVKFSPDKDFTDLEAALKLIKIESVATIRLFNALGGRLDHSLGNLLYLFRTPFKDKVQICTPNETIGVLSKKEKENKKWKELPFYEDNEGALLHIATEMDIPICQFPSQGIYHYHCNQQSIIQDLQLVWHCADHPAPFTVQTDRELLFTVPLGAPYVFEAVVGQIISLIPLRGPACGITTKGLRWELENGTLDKDFISISNVATAIEISISLQSGSLLCVVNRFNL